MEKTGLCGMIPVYQIQIEIREKHSAERRNPEGSDTAGEEAQEIIGDKGDGQVKQTSLVPFHHAAADRHNLPCGIAGKIKQEIIGL